MDSGLENQKQLKLQQMVLMDGKAAEMDGAEAGGEAAKRDAAAFVSGDVEENVEETGETDELEEALSESAEMTEGDFCLCNCK